MAICTLSTSIHISLIILYAIVLAEASLDIVSEKTTFEVGDTIVINCTTVSHSAQSVQWFFNSNPIPEKQYTVISADLSQLVIPQSNFSNAGNYSCALLEALLEEIATVQIQVGEKPHPVSSFNCFSFNGIDILCTWDDGGLTNIPTTSTLMYKAFMQNHLILDSIGRPVQTPAPLWIALISIVTPIPALFTVMITTTAAGTTSQLLQKMHWALLQLGSTSIQKQKLYHLLQVTSKLLLRVDNVLMLAGTIPVDGSIQNILAFSVCSIDCDISQSGTQMNGHILYHKDLQTKRVCTLEGYTQYSIQLSAGLTGQTKYWSDWSDIVVVRTLEQAPISHLEMSYKNLDNKDESSKRDVTVFWKPLGVRQMKGEVLGYTITMSEEGENITISWNASANATSQVLQGLEKYASYDIQVVTFNSAGSSPPSLLTILDLALAPSEPLRVSAVAIDKNTILVGWEPPEFPRGRIREYKIYWRSSSSELNLDGSTNKLQYEVEGLQEYVLYEFYIQAYRADGGGGLSQAVSQYTKEAVKLGAAEITNISATSRSISLRWQPPHTLHSRNNGNPIPMPDDYSILYNITYCIPSEPSSCGMTITDASGTVVYSSVSVGSYSIA
ncbi:granulocyte colony-stimulating factor receptor-like isoform X2 [Ptychodera flava]|uniref:granulocyte colony-stimulating factor receptor-like isoform X2 n=1 Tax=Ptychodera flava TaxID=63121 RepID=UPI00396A7016